MRTAITHRSSSRPEEPVNPAEPPPPWLAAVAHQVRTLQFGVIQVVVHDSRVVQIERTERTRFEIARNTASD